jgi:sec-independent protein translocase protein TatB
MFGFSFEKLIVIGVIAIVIVGPARLPQYAAKLAQLIKTLRSFLDAAKDRVQAEMGPEFEDLDWKKLDPRQYDPRKIIRDALLDDSDAPVVRRAAPEAESQDAGSSTASDAGASLALVTDDDIPSVPERKAS